MQKVNYDKLKQAGDIHKQVEKYLRNKVLVGLKPVLLYDIAQKTERKIEELCGGLGDHSAGIAFPTGLNINHCAAHFTPNPTKGDRELALGQNDLVKIDYGVHIDGNIIDGAFTFSFSDKFDKLIEASKEATWGAIKMAGPDAWLRDIGANTEEIIESYEVEIDGKTLPLKSIRDLCGHQIKPYLIHAGKAVPNIRFPQYQHRMKSGEEYAIETFPTTGTGLVEERRDECSHYMLNYMDKDYKKKGARYPFFNTSLNYFNTLAFCKRWIIDREDINKDFDNITYKNVNDKLKKLGKCGAINAYPPLYDKKGSYVSQTEKSIFITDSGRDVLN
jgi:methionyl aminopeptidase